MTKRPDPISYTVIALILVGLLVTGILFLAEIWQWRGPAVAFLFAVAIICAAKLLS